MSAVAQPQPQPAVGRVDVKASKRPRDPLLIASLVVIGLLVAAAILAPLLAPYEPTETDILAAGEGPSADHLLGTDQVGRDILSRLLHGARASLIGPAIVVAATAILGTAIAIVAAWVGGAFDTFVSRVLDVLFAFPGLIVAILAVALFGSGLVAPVIALTIAYLPYMARILRSSAVKERSLPYIAALHAGGFPAWSICVRHLLPNIAPFIAVQAAIGFGYALIDLSALSYLGLGLQPPTAEWGLMIAEGQPALLAGQPAQSLFAGLMIVISVVSFNVLGERLARRVEQAPHVR
jgi:peptide/nickel transport system permease protein